MSFEEELSRNINSKVIYALKKFNVYLTKFKIWLELSICQAKITKQKYTRLNNSIENRMGQYSYQQELNESLLEENKLFRWQNFITWTVKFPFIKLVSR